MLKTCATNVTPATYSTSAQLESLLRNHARLSRELRIGRVDEADARNGGGFKELSRLAFENDELEQAVDCCEDMLREEGLSTAEIYLNSLDTSGCSVAELEKLERHDKMFSDCPDAEPLPELGGGDTWL